MFWKKAPEIRPETYWRGNRLFTVEGGVLVAEAFHSDHQADLWKVKTEKGNSSGTFDGESNAKEWAEKNWELAR